jgi:hypothetical protein
MESEENMALPTIIPSPDELIPTVQLNVDVLRHIATFLDFQSLQQFRLVSRECHTVGTPILMKRGYYNLTHSSNGNERRDLLKGAIHYSSWKISHSVYESAKLLQDDQMWQNVKSLIIHQKIPGLSRGFYVWAWETIQRRCPNLQEITFMLQEVMNTKVNPEVLSDYELAIQGLPNASFPKITNLRNLSSVYFKGIFDSITAYFAQNLLQACTNLRHLSFCPIFDLESFRIFEYLQNNPRLLMNLHSFAFKFGNYFSDKSDQESRYISFTPEQSDFVRLVTQNSSASLPLQFSENLQSLFWDLPFYLHDQFLPGVLTPSVTSSLFQLSLSGNVEKLGEIVNGDAPFPIKLSFPNFPRLRALKVGLHIAHGLSAPELVDSAPNLYVFEMKGMKDIQYHPELSSSLWRRTDKESVSNPKHHQLRIFCTDIPFNGLTDIGGILSKFPNLVEVRLGRFNGVTLDQFLSFVESTHLKLQILSWKCCEKFTLEELFHHLIRVPEQLPALNNYSLRWQGEGRYFTDRDDVTWPDSIQDMEEVANSLLNLPSKSDSALVINLLLKSLSCNCMPNDESPANDCRQCYLHHFIRSHNLPIRIHSVEEIEEVQRKYEWNHRFASNWIYK